MASPENTNNNILEEENEPQDVEMLCDSSSSSDTDYDGITDADVMLSDLEETENKDGTIKKPYEVLSQAEIHERQEVAIASICDILSIPRAEAAILLLYYSWNVGIIPDKWFSDGQKIRDKLGLIDVSFDGAGSSNTKDLSCGICLGKFPPELVAGPACGHLFCNTCWAGYFEKSLKDPAPPLLLRCPDTSCGAAVGQDMINMLASKDDKEKYAHAFMKSYIDYNLKANWCPRPGCKHALILLIGDNLPKVTCKCTHTFCWKCSKEAHQPIACSTYCNWTMECVVQSENFKSITNMNGCPSCWYSFEMSGSHKHMQCPSCEYHFCKLCRASWLGNGSWNGDEFKHTCSKGKEKVENDDREEKARIAQDSLKKYSNSYNHWMATEMHLEAARQELYKLKNGQLKAIAEKAGLTEAELSFYTDAWMQIADCKRVIKWTHVAEYYIPPFETNRRNLIQFIMRHAEFVVVQLYQVEAQLTTVLNMEKLPPQFSEIRDRLCLKTGVARNYFDNMVWIIENRIKDLKTLRDLMGIKSLEQGIITTTAASIEETPEQPVNKNCEHCQFPKNGPVGFLCDMCYH